MRAAGVTPLREMRTESPAPSVTKESHTGVHMPDPHLTHGQASYQTVDQICAAGKSTKDERHVSESEKDSVYEKYGIAKCEGYCSRPQGCEIDHLISLELGGANTEDNLWPQPYDGDWNAHDKDRLENKLHKMVCAKQITLKEAQHEIADDWVTAYQRYVGERRPFKPVVHCK